MGAVARAATAPLRAVYLSGNPVQASTDPTGKLRGPAVDLAAEIAKRAGRPVEMIAGNGVEGVLTTLREGRADIGFVAFDPTRSAGLVFSPPYLSSLNGFAVLAASPIAAMTAVDRPGVRIGVNLGDAGGLFLKRTVAAATLQGIATPEAGRDLLVAGSIDVLAANRQRLDDLLARDPRFRILPGHYFAVPQTVATREGDKPLGDLVARTVKESLASGFVQRSIASAGLVGAEAAAPQLSGAPR